MKKEIEGFSLEEEKELKKILNIQKIKIKNLLSITKVGFDNEQKAIKVEHMQDNGRYATRFIYLDNNDFMERLELFKRYVVLSNPSGLYLISGGL